MPYRPPFSDIKLDGRSKQHLFPQSKNGHCARHSPPLSRFAGATMSNFPTYQARSVSLGKGEEAKRRDVNREHPSLWGSALPFDPVMHAVVAPGRAAGQTPSNQSPGTTAGETNWSTAIQALLSRDIPTRCVPCPLVLATSHPPGEYRTPRKKPAHAAPPRRRDTGPRHADWSP